VSPNRGSLDVGRAEELEIPPFAKPSFTGPVINPLNMYAGARLMAYGSAAVEGKHIWPWQRRRVAGGANRIAQGRAVLYGPMDYGSMT